MVALKGMELQIDCQKCPLMATDGADELSPMMCIALWATKHEVKHCTQGKILNAKIKKQNEMMIVVDVEDNGLPYSFWKDWWDEPFKKEVEEWVD